MKRGIWYFVHIIVIISTLVAGAYFFENEKQIAIQTFNANPYSINLKLLTFHGCIGVLLGLENIVNEIKRKGKLKINIPKIIVMGIPSLYFSLGLAIYNLKPILVPVLQVINYQTMATSQVVLGYVIATSFYKMRPNREAESN